MNFLPVVGRELRVAARRRGPFWARFTAAAIAILFGGGSLWLGSDWQSATSQGRATFVLLATLGFGFCLMAGPVFTTDVLSQEKREGTLGLLFLTDLRGYDIVLGKLAASSVGALFSLAACLPVLAVPLMMGGVALGEFGRVALVLGNTLLFSLAVGMLVSACSVQARSAFAVTGFMLFLFVLVFQWVAEALAEANSGSLTAYVLRLLDLSHGLRLSRTPVFAPVAAEYWASVATIALLSLLCLACTSWVLPRAWHEAPTGRRAAWWRARGHQWVYGADAPRQARRRRLLALSPLAWLTGRNRFKHLLLRWAVALGLAVWLGVCTFAGGQWTSWGITVVIAVFFQFPVKWLMASEATQRWIEDRQAGALELLLTTPLTEKEILLGQMRGLWRLFGAPVLAILAVESVIVFLGWWNQSPDAEAAHFALAAMVLFVWDLHTLGWVGTWLGLIRKKSNRAFTGALCRVLAVPWLVFLIGVFLTGMPGEWLVAWWIVTCGFTNLALYSSAKSNLYASFRLAAAGLFGTPSRG